MDSASKNGALRNVWTWFKIVFTVVPIVAGFDKFTNILANWESYVNPALAGMLPFSPSVFMGIVGVVEISAGIIVHLRPRLGGQIVAAWLVCIALSLLLGGHYLDVAVRDLVMAVAALALAKLTPLVDTRS